jgi:hypothetical protein
LLLVLQCLRREAELKAEYWFRRRLEHKRDPGVDKDDGRASFGQRLVQNPLGVAESPRNIILRHDSTSNLIRHKYDRAGESGHAQRQALRRGHDIVIAQHKIAEPKCRAVDHHDPVFAGFAPKCLDEGDGLFDDDPLPTPSCHVAFYPHCHFGVTRLCSRDQDRL